MRRQPAPGSAAVSGRGPTKGGRTNPTSVEVALLAELEAERAAFRDHVRKLEARIRDLEAHLEHAHQDLEACTRAFLALGGELP